MSFDVTTLPWWVPEDKMSPEAKAVLGSAWAEGIAPTQEEAQAFHARLVQLPSKEEQASVVQLVLRREDVATNYSKICIGNYLRLLKSSGWFKQNRWLIPSSSENTNDVGVLAIKPDCGSKQ